MEKVDTNSQANVGNIEIKKSKKIFSKHNHYTIVIEGIKHHYVDKPADSRDASTTGRNFTPIKLSGNKIHDTALIFSKMCECDKTYKPVEFISKMVENRNVSTASAILSNKNLTNEEAARIIATLKHDEQAKILNEMTFEKIVKILGSLPDFTSQNWILQDINFSKALGELTGESLYKAAETIKHMHSEQAAKFIEKMFSSNAIRTTNVVSVISDYKAAKIISKLPDKTAAKLIETMATYKPSDPYINPDMFLSMDKAIVILSNKNLPAEKAAAIIKNLPNEVADKIFSRLPAPIQTKIYTNIDDQATQLRLANKINL